MFAYLFNRTKRVLKLRISILTALIKTLAWFKDGGRGKVHVPGWSRTSNLSVNTLYILLHNNIPIHWYISFYRVVLTSLIRFIEILF
jgi:hypothetical protein